MIVNDSEITFPKLIKTVSEELSLEEKLVKEVCENYWTNIKDELVNPTSNCIKIAYLGNFRFMPKKVMIALASKLYTLKAMRDNNKKYTAQSLAIVRSEFRELWAIKQKFGYRITKEGVKYKRHLGYTKYEKSKK